MRHINRKLKRIAGLTLALTLFAGTVFTVQAEEGILPGAEPVNGGLIESPAAPSEVPSTEPSTEPATAPAAAPSTEPATAPSAAPSTEPSTAPSAEPATEPSAAPEALMPQPLQAPESIEDFNKRIDEIPANTEGIENLSGEQETLNQEKGTVQETLEQEQKAEEELIKAENEASEIKEKAEQDMQAAKGAADAAKAEVADVNTEAIQWLANQLENKDSAVYNYFFVKYASGKAGTSLDSQGPNFAPAVIEEMKTAGLIDDESQFLFRIYREENTQDGTPSFNIFWTNEGGADSELKKVARYNTASGDYAVGETKTSKKSVDTVIDNQKTSVDIFVIDGGTFAKKAVIVTDKVTAAISSGAAAEAATEQLKKAQEKLEEAAGNVADNQGKQQTLTAQLTELQNKLDTIAQKITDIQKQIAEEQARAEELRRQQEQAQANNQPTGDIEEQLAESEAAIATLETQLANNQAAAVAAIEDTTQQLRAAEPINSAEGQVLGAVRTKTPDTKLQSAPSKTTEPAINGDTFTADTETVTIEDAETAMAATPMKTSNLFTIWWLWLLLVLAVSYLVYCYYKNRKDKKQN